MLPPTMLAPLRAFRQELYDDLGSRQDSLCDLLDAVLSAPGPLPLVHLSLCPAFRRRWTWLLALAVWPRWLARPLVAHPHLPWQRPCTAARLTPGRVRRALGGFLPTVGSPARAPLVRGKAPGCQLGQRPGPARRYAVGRRTHPAAA